jgi:cytochrome c oxidase cbb3-type subunit III
MSSSYSRVLRFIVMPIAVALCACNDAPGRPGKNPEVARPDEVLDFNILYKQNCSGCHGPQGNGGAAIALHNPVYLAVADDNVIRHTASNGVPGTPMTPFAQSAGGMLTDKQVDVIVRGIRAWARPGLLAGISLPSYKQEPPGDAQRGAAVYATFCASCHGAKGEGGERASSIVDTTYLALVSDQQLRTIVIAGWPAVGSPDWRNDVTGQPMSAQQISDVVAWLVAKRAQVPGQLYSDAESKGR